MFGGKEFEDSHNILDGTMMKESISGGLDQKCDPLCTNLFLYGYIVGQLLPECRKIRPPFRDFESVVGTVSRTGSPDIFISSSGVPHYLSFQYRPVVVSIGSSPNRLFARDLSRIRANMSEITVRDSAK